MNFSIDAVLALYHSGAYVPLAIVLAFVGLTWGSKNIKLLSKLDAPGRPHYVAAVIGFLSVIVPAALGGNLPTVGMLVAAATTAYALFLPGAPSVPSTPSSGARPGFVRPRMMFAIAVMGGAILLAGCSGASRQSTLGYALATTTAIAADMTPQNDALIQADIAGRPWSTQAAGDAALTKYEHARDKVIADVKIALDAIGGAFQLNDDASLKTAQTALGTLLADVVTMKGIK